MRTVWIRKRSAQSTPSQTYSYYRTCVVLCALGIASHRIRYSGFTSAGELFGVHFPKFANNKSHIKSTFLGLPNVKNWLILIYYKEVMGCANS